MTLPAPPTGLYPEDYDRIEAAVMETVRGRWFLLEYARRQRAFETERLVHAVDRLERYAASRAEEINRLATAEIPSSENSEAEPPEDFRLPRRLAERAREFAATLRASGLDESLCAQADALADQFAAYIAAPRGERAQPAEIVRFERSIEIEAAANETIAADDLSTEDLSMEDTAAETRFAEPLEAEPIAIVETVSETPTAEVILDPRLAGLSRLDHLPANEKLRLFG